MARVLAKVSGIALKPGISKNNRLYTREAIARMVADAQERIETGGGLGVTQYTHHGAGDDTSQLCGALRSMSLDEHGNARFTADIADTPHGRTIASLLDTSDGKPAFLKGVSIRGQWDGPVSVIKDRYDAPVTTAPGVLCAGLDYTATPGVDGAEVDGFEWAHNRPAETADGRPLIYESVTEARVTVISEDAPVAEVSAAVTEGAPAPPAAARPPGVAETAADGLRDVLRGVLALEAAPVLRDGLTAEAATVPMSKRDSGLAGGGHVWADPGYQADKKQRYDVSTRALAKAAYSYINQDKNAKLYSAAQLKRVKGRIIKALKGFGVHVAAEGWTLEPARQLTESVAEMFGDPGLCGSWSVTATNGPVSICLSSYAMDPADLDVILRAAAASASASLAALDPDMDGDVDVPGAGPRSNPDGDKPKPKETAPAAPGPADTATQAESPALEAEAAEADVTETDPADPAPEPETVPEENADQAEEEPAVSEPTTTETAAAQAPAATETTTPAPAPPGITLTQEMFQAMLDRMAPAAPAPVAATETVPPAPAVPVETAPAAPAPAAPPAPAVTETDEQAEAALVAEGVRAALAAEGFQVPGLAESRDQRVARLVQEQVTAMKQHMVATGTVSVQRAGLTPGGEVSEHRQPPVVAGSGPAAGLNGHGLPQSWPDKPLHQYTSEELANYTGPVLDHHVMGRNASTELL